MNNDAPWPRLEEARARVLGIQAKLHPWATDDPGRRFDDLSNLVCDPAFLTVGWDRVRGKPRARTAGVDGVEPADVDGSDGEAFLREVREDLKGRRFRPLPVRERMIPKASCKFRRLGYRRRVTALCRPASSWSSSRSSRRISSHAAT